jgi:hypothetical protein
MNTKKVETAENPGMKIKTEKLTACGRNAYGMRHWKPT